MKASQPWFLVLPGPARLERVSVSMCPSILFLQVLLECSWLTTQPWEEQKPPMIQKFFTSDWRSLMVCWLLVAPAPAPELDDLGLGEEENFLSLRSFLIVWYCVEVAAASRALASVGYDIVRPLLVAASSIQSK